MADDRARRFVWDLPTRLFHWLLVALIAFSWWSERSFHMDWHGVSGVVLLGLLIFRLLWGLFGASTARFGQFVKGPRTVWAYLRPSGEGVRAATIGHNPLGGWSVVALLLVLVTIVVSGLFAVDVDGIESGPLSVFVDFDQGRTAAAIHHFCWNLLLALIVVHVAAILFYLVVKRRNLTWTMITGSERTTQTDGEGAVPGSRWRLLAILAVAAAIAWWVDHGFRLA